MKIENAAAKQEIVFSDIAYGNYFIQVFYMNKKVAEKTTLALNAATLLVDPLEISDVTSAIKEVKISAQKNIIERKYDKLIYNVENTIASAADDAITILQKAPGISIDNDGNISMRGKSGVLVMINGKPTYLQGEQLNSLLKSTMANQISKIEIISNPSSKYDANGNAGIVNIVLKKDQRQGTNGTLTLSYGTGVYRKSNNSISLNHRTKKLNLFASYNFVHNIGFNDLELYRQFFTDGVYQGAYRQHNYLRFPAYYNIPKIGIDFKPNEKTTIGVVVSGLTNKFLSYADNKTFIEDSSITTKSYYTTTNKSKDFWYNYGLNLNMKHTFDSVGKELTADADYVHYAHNTTQNFTTHYYDLQNAETKTAYLLLGKINGFLDIKALKVDYVQPLKNNAKIECGAKTSFVKANNNLIFYDQSNGASILDSSQSNHFIYSENINAFYASYSVEKKKTSVQLGLRTEQTIADGKQIINSNSFNRNYWQLFPTLFINYTFNKNHALGLSCSRRIQRPTYQQLNPFKFFIDASTYKEGNPFLVPQNTYLAELNYTIDQKYLITFSSGITNKSITEVLIPAEGQSNITIQTDKNVNKQYVHTISISAPLKVMKWWNSSFDASFYSSLYDGVLASQIIHSSTQSFNAKTMHTFSLPKQFTLQVDGFIQYAEHYSFTTLHTFGAVNLALQKSAFNKRTTIKLSANDIFYNSRFRGSSNFNNYHEDYYVQRDSRTLMLAVSYRFGNTSLPANRRRTGGAEEEKQRAG